MIAGTYMSVSLSELKSVGAHVGHLRDPDVKTFITASFQAMTSCRISNPPSSNLCALARACFLSAREQLN